MTYTVTNPPNLEQILTSFGEYPYNLEIVTTMDQTYVLPTNVPLTNYVMNICHTSDSTGTLTVNSVSIPIGNMVSFVFSPETQTWYSLVTGAGESNTTIHADSNPPIAGNVQLTSGTNVTLAQLGNSISINAEAPGINQLTGDVSAGPGSGSQVASLANLFIAPESYTNANITVDTKGRITAASNGSNTTVHADSSPNLSGDVQLVSGTGISLIQGGQSITVNSLSTVPALLQFKYYQDNGAIESTSSGTQGASAVTVTITPLSTISVIKFDFSSVVRVDGNGDGNPGIGFTIFKNGVNIAASSDLGIEYMAAASNEFDAMTGFTYVDPTPGTGPLVYTVYFRSLSDGTTAFLGNGGTPRTLAVSELLMS